MYILCQQAIKGVLKVVLSIESLRLLETLSPSAVFLFPYENAGMLVKSLQF